MGRGGVGIEVPVRCCTECNKYEGLLRYKSRVGS